jgi:TolA-binding protein
MDELVREARRVGANVEAGWQARQVEAQLGVLHARLRRRRVTRAALATVASLLLLAGAASVAGVWRRPVAARVAPVPAPGDAVRVVEAAPPALAPVPPAPPTEAPIALGDGSAIYVDGAATRLVTHRVSATQVAIGLDAGGARFEVPEQPARRFRVVAGAVTVETHGGRFHVRRAGQRVEVAADRGEVVVRWGHELELVAPGAVASFPPRAAASAADSAAAPESMDVLLATAVAARLSGAPAEAAQALERALALHADDARAPLAAFTLGRVQLEELDAPAAAAAAFVRAQALAPAGPLAEDALAREVEAWWRAGDGEQARARAAAYLTRYPDGRRAHAVRQFGGLAPAP